MHSIKVIQTDNDWLMIGWPRMKCIRIIQAYMIHLATGSSLLCKAITVGTMKAYGTAVGKLISAAAGFDPRQHPGQTGNQFAREYNMILEEQKRWAKMPNRRENVTIKMFKWMYQRFCTGFYPTHSYQYQITMWVGFGLLSGIRKSEYAQESRYKVFGNHELVTGSNEARAFTLEDILFYTEDHKKISHQQAMAEPKLVHKASSRWRYQKNGDNGEKKTFLRGRAIDPVQCLQAIVKNFIDLVGYKTNIPLALYKDQNGKLIYIYDGLINKMLQEAASAVYNLDPIKDAADIKRFTTHSIRVGACCLLWAAGFDEKDIKHLLRWRSDSFLRYLRNMDFVCRKHAEAITNLSTMPDFI